MAMELSRTVENELDDIVSGHLVLDNALLDVIRVIPCPDVFLLPCIDGAPDVSGCAGV